DCEDSAGVMSWKWINILAVLWRHAAEKTRGLWVNVPQDVPAHMISMFLTRRETLPLHLHLRPDKESVPLSDAIAAAATVLHLLIFHYDGLHGKLSLESKAMLPNVTQFVWHCNPGHELQDEDRKTGHRIVHPESFPNLSHFVFQFHPRQLYLGFCLPEYIAVLTSLYPRVETLEVRDLGISGTVWEGAILDRMDGGFDLSHVKTLKVVRTRRAEVDRLLKVSYLPKLRDVQYSGVGYDPYEDLRRLRDIEGDWMRMDLPELQPVME
ncbi:hypothetical protein SISSUDRAFT_1038760, partial [Sistotremastrum suecicum HHB10207 ss-3]